MTIEEKFLSAEKQSGASFIRVSESHPTDLYLGIENGERALLLVIDGRAPESSSYAAIEIHVRKRTDGKLALVVTLKKRELKELFGRLVEDLVRTTRNEPDSEKAAALILKRISWWHKLFDKCRSAVMTESELRGMLAELYLLREVLMPKYGKETALRSWQGPYDAPKDFRLPDIDIEVKSTHADATSVRISSLEQLDPSLNPLFLCTIEMERGNKEKCHQSVSEFVASIRSLCETSVAAADLLEKALGEYGFFDLADYDDIHFRFGSASFFEVKGDFPRLTRSSVSEAILKCQYEISMKHLDDYKKAI